VSESETNGVTVGGNSAEGTHEQSLLDAFFARKRDVTSALEELSAVARDLGAKSLHERIDAQLVRKLVEDRFHLVVVGEFNHGKTTFVNALLGEKALATGVTPTTAAIHHLKYADHPEAAVVYASGAKSAVDFADVKRFAVGGDGHPEEVDYLEIGYPAALLKERILLVDTPGVNDLSLQRSDITYSYIPRADAVLFLLDAGQILKESERVFLQDKLLKASRDKIVFVITKWDILSDSERAEALAYAKDKLAKLVADPVVFPVSAEIALSGRAAESGLPELLAHLTKFLAEERGKILLGNALGEGLSASTLLQKGIDARRRSIAMKADELDRRIAALEADLAGQAQTIEQRRVAIREEIRGIKVGAKKDLDRFVDDMIRQLPNVIDTAKAGDLKQFLPAYLEDEFKKWAEHETREIAAQLESLAEKTIALVRDDAMESSKRVSAVLGTDNKRLDVQVDTLAYDVGVVALLVGGGFVMLVNPLVGIMVAATGPLLALVMRGRVEEEFKKQAKERAPDVLRAAAARVAPKLDEMIEGFGATLDAWVVTAGEELHREVLEVLRGTREARANGAEDDAKARDEVEAQHARLAAGRARIEELRGGLALPERTPDRVRVA
jgi:small GTP-binding protein